MAVETMFAWKLRVIIFVVIATSLFVSGHKVPRENNCKKALRKAASLSDYFFRKAIGVNQSYTLRSVLKIKKWYTSAQEMKYAAHQGIRKVSVSLQIMYYASLKKSRNFAAMWDIQNRTFKRLWHAQPRVLLFPFTTELPSISLLSKAAWKRPHGWENQQRADT